MCGTSTSWTHCPTRRIAGLAEVKAEDRYGKAYAMHADNMRGTGSGELRVGFQLRTRNSSKDWIQVPVEVPVEVDERYWPAPADEHRLLSYGGCC